MAAHFVSLLLRVLLDSWRWHGLDLSHFLKDVGDVMCRAPRRETGVSDGSMLWRG